MGALKSVRRATRHFKHRAMHTLRKFPLYAACEFISMHIRNSLSLTIFNRPRHTPTRARYNLIYLKHRAHISHLLKQIPTHMWKTCTIVVSFERTVNINVFKCISFLQSVFVYNFRYEQLSVRVRYEILLSERTPLPYATFYRTNYICVRLLSQPQFR